MPYAWRQRPLWGCVECFYEDWEESRKNCAQQSVHCQAGSSLRFLKLPMAIPPLSRALSSSGIKTGMPRSRSAILTDPHQGQWDGFRRVRIFIAASIRMSFASLEEVGMAFFMGLSVSPSVAHLNSGCGRCDRVRAI